MQLNKQLLFRGKDIENGMWVYGYPMIFKDGTYCIMTAHNEKMCKVIPETLTQFRAKIGDVNFYDGDIIQVDYRDDQTSWTKTEVIYYYFGSVSPQALFLAESDEDYTISKIGTVWDNPELMEKIKIQL